MFDDAGPGIPARCPAAFIRLEVDHGDRCRAALLLEAAGGHRFLPAEGTVYEFLTSAARDEALDLVRSRFGWTVATAFDGRPWLPGLFPRDTEFRIGPAVHRGTLCPPRQPVGSGRSEGR